VIWSGCMIIHYMHFIHSLFAVIKCVEYGLLWCTSDKFFRKDFWISGKCPQSVAVLFCQFCITELDEIDS